MIGLLHPAQSLCGWPIGLGAACTALAALTIEGVIVAVAGGPLFTTAAEEFVPVLALPEARADGGSPGPPPIMRRFNAAFMCLWMGSAIN